MKKYPSKAQFIKDNPKPEGPGPNGRPWVIKLINKKVGWGWVERLPYGKIPGLPAKSEQPKKRAYNWPHRLTPHRQKAITEWVEDGLSMHAIAKKTRVHHTTIQRWLGLMGLKTKDHLQGRRLRYYTKKELDRLTSLMSMKQIKEWYPGVFGERYGVGKREFKLLQSGYYYKWLKNQNQ